MQLVYKSADRDSLHVFQVSRYKLQYIIKGETGYLLALLEKSLKTEFHVNDSQDICTMYGSVISHIHRHSVGLSRCLPRILSETTIAKDRVDQDTGEVFGCACALPLFVGCADMIQWTYLASWNMKSFLKRFKIKCYVYLAIVVVCSLHLYLHNLSFGLIRCSRL